MADIRLECPTCGKISTVSEYVSVQTITCADCGQEIEIALAAKTKSLQLKKAGSINAPPPPTHRKMAGLPSSKSGPPPVAARAGRPPKVPRGRGKTKHDKEQRARKKKNHPWILQWFLMLLIAGVLVGFQYLSGEPGMMDMYRWVRLVILPAIWLSAIIVAFQETMLQGFLCLLLPPYLIFYMLGHCDNYAARGAFTALVIAVATEVYFLPDQSVVQYANTTVGNIVSGGQDMIKEAGESDVEKY